MFLIDSFNPISLSFSFFQKASAPALGGAGGGSTRKGAPSDPGQQGNQKAGKRRTGPTSFRPQGSADPRVREIADQVMEAHRPKKSIQRPGIDYPVEPEVDYDISALFHKVPIQRETTQPEDQNAKQAGGAISQGAAAISQAGASLRDASQGLGRKVSKDPRQGARQEAVAVAMAQTAQAQASQTQTAQAQESQTQGAKIQGETQIASSLGTVSSNKTTSSEPTSASEATSKGLTKVLFPAKVSQKKAANPKDGLSKAKRKFLAPLPKATAKNQAEEAADVNYLKANFKTKAEDLMPSVVPPFQDFGSESPESQTAPGIGGGSAPFLDPGQSAYGAKPGEGDWSQEEGLHVKDPIDSYMDGDAFVSDEAFMQYFTKAERNNQAIVLAFLAILTLVGLAFWIVPDRPESAMEKRKLQMLPKVTLKACLSGDLMREMENYYTDQFPLRDRFIGLHTRVQQVMADCVPTLTGKKGDKVRLVPTHRDTAQGGEDFRKVLEQKQKEGVWKPGETGSDATSPTASEATVQEAGSAGTEDPKNTSAETTSSTDASTSESRKASDSEKASETKATKKDKRDQKSQAMGENQAVNRQAGAIFIAQDRGFEVFGFGPIFFKNYGKRLNYFQEQLEGKARLISLLVPTAVAFYGPEEYKTGDHSQYDAINLAYDTMNSSIVKVDAYRELGEHYDEYLYLKSDHHWNGRGAYYAYKAFCDALGLKAQPLSEMKPIPTGSTFMGSLYGFSGNDPFFETHQDTIEMFQPRAKGTLTMYSDATMSDPAQGILLDPSAAEWQPNHYLLFSGGDVALSLIKSDTKNGRKILVIKDSYGNAFVPYLMNDYEEVYVVDPRFFKDPLIPFITQKKIQDVLVLNYTFCPSNDGWIDPFDYLIGLPDTYFNE